MNPPRIQPGQTRIGWIGTGVMGRSMAGHLLRAGYDVTVFSRTRSKAAKLLEAGATWADNPRLVAAQCDVVFSIVGFPDDVRSVHLHRDWGTLAGCRPGTVLIDMTTSQPTLASEIAEAAILKQVHSLDAPVSGGDTGARQATLSIMVGGDKASFDRVRPLMESMGKTIVHQGPSGAGQHTKMVNQTLIASGMVGVCEALLYAQAAGMNIETVLQSVSSGAAGSWSLSHLAPRIVNGDFDPGFFVDHFIKDMGIALEESRRMSLQLPGLELAHRLYGELADSGHGQDGTQALVLALAKMNETVWKIREAV